MTGTTHRGTPWCRAASERFLVMMGPGPTPRRPSAGPETGPVADLTSRWQALRAAVGLRTAAVTTHLRAAAPARRGAHPAADGTPNQVSARAGTMSTPGPEWLWSVDSAGLFTASNSAGLDLIGYGPAELVGQPVSLIMDLEEMTRVGAVLAATGGLQSSWPGLFVAARHRNGTAIWLHADGDPRHGPDGQIVGFDGTCRPAGPDAGNLAARQRIKDRMEAMLADRLLVTAFQPIVGLATGSVVGVEGLSRFVSEPTVSPDVWFADAASVGLGIRLELLAVEIALTSAARLPAHLYVSVNASPATCLDHRLADLITRGPLDPRRIVLELTERDAVADYEPLLAALDRFRQLGVRIAVDDAGSGFASFQHILQLRPDLIKLDRCIVADLDTDPAGRALCAAVVSFAARIGAEVLAEGVENAAEWRAVIGLGIDSGQGFFFGRPSVKPREWARWRPGIAARQVVLARAGLPEGRRDRHTVPDGRPSRFCDVTLDPATGRPGGRPAGRRGDADPAAILRGGVDVAVGILDALPDATAILDRSGTIVAVNRAWRMFALDNGGAAETTGVGVSYVDVCARAAESGNSDAVEVLAGLRAVLAGEVTESEREYTCDSSVASRWFISRISSIGAPPGGAVASQINITRRKRAERELEHQACHDPLTELANRTLFTTTLAAALRERPGNRGRGVGVVYLELGTMNSVNDTFGRAAGDELLLVATNRMRRLLRPQDTLARLGPCDFAVCAPRSTAAGLVALALRFSGALAEPHQIHGQPVSALASIGTHLAAPGDTAATMLQAADQAMYAMKDTLYQRNSA